MSSIAVVGAGLVGSLLSIYLARRGFDVELIERRPDMRSTAISAGRSINLAISTRGISALAKVGLDQQILKHAVPMKGRMIHAVDGELAFQPYGTDDSQYINSISRGTLNKELLTAAEKTGKVRLLFNQRATGVDIENNLLHLHDEIEDRQYSREFSLLIGTDGSASAIRSAMEKLSGIECHQSELNYGYKELVVLPTADGGFKMDRDALHIWPRGNFMLIALPNFEGSFTCTLFLPFEGTPGFAELVTSEQVGKFFAEHFADAVPLISDLEKTFFTNPTGHMVTVKSAKWHVDGKILLMGDAAHGIVPFFGQGMNCGFEDCSEFERLFDEYHTHSGPDWSGLFERMTRERVPNTNAIADMAVENFVEMRDKVGDKNFLMRKAVEKILQTHFPQQYRSRYSLVTFSNVPYTVALEVGVVQELLLERLCVGLERAEDVDLAYAKKLINSMLSEVMEKCLTASAR